MQEKSKKIKITPELKRKAQLVYAAMGGQAIAKKRGKKGMRALGKKGAEARWKKNKPKRK